MKSGYIRYIYGAFLCGILLFGSCAKETPLDDPIPPAGHEGEGYLSFRVSTGDPSQITDTKSLVIGTSDENRVNSVRVILYDTGLTPTVQYAFHFNIKTNPNPSGDDYYTGRGVYVNGNLQDREAVYTPSDGAAEGHFITFAQWVEKQDYQMLVLINPTYIPGMGDLSVPEMEQDPNGDDHPHNLYYLTRQGQALSALEDAFRMSSGQIASPGGIAYIGTDESHFLMTNHQGLVQVKGDADIFEEKDQAHAAPVEINVDRVVAKVIVREAETGLTAYPGGAQVTGLEYGLNYANHYSHWLRRLSWLKKTSPWDQAQDPSVTVKKEAAGTDLDRAVHYAEDPNFSGLYTPPGFIPGAEPHALRDENFEVFSTASAMKELVKAGEGTVNYVLENTLQPEDQLVDLGYYTRVSVRCNYIPAPSATVNNIQISAAESYYVFRGYAFTYAQLSDFVGNPSTIPAALKELEDIVVDMGFFAAMVQIEPTESREMYGVNYYKSGINYYTVPIRHFDFSDDVSGAPARGVGTYGYFGVVRNNIYTVTIRSITGPGSPEPDHYAYISAGVNIVPWARTGTEVEIGEAVNLSTHVTYQYYRGSESVPFELDYDYDVTMGQSLIVTAEIIDRYYDEINLPSPWYEHGVVESQPATVSADPAANVVNIRYPALASASVVTFRYAERPDQGRELRDPIVRSYPAQTLLTWEDIQTDGLVYSVLEDNSTGSAFLYTHEQAVYGGSATSLPLMLEAGGQVEIYLLYDRPGVKIYYWTEDDGGVRTPYSGPEMTADNYIYYTNQDPGLILYRNTLIGSVPVVLPLDGYEFLRCEPEFITVKNTLPKPDDPLYATPQEWNVIDVVYQEVILEPSAMPTILWPQFPPSIQGKVSAGGTGIPGALITVYWPDGTTSNAVVDENGDWKTDYLDDNPGLEFGSYVYASQKEENKSESEKAFIKLYSPWGK